MFKQHFIIANNGYYQLIFNNILCPTDITQTNIKLILNEMSHIHFNIKKMNNQYSGTFNIIVYVWNLLKQTVSTTFGRRFNHFNGHWKYNKTKIEFHGQ